MIREKRGAALYSLYSHSLSTLSVPTFLNHVFFGFTLFLLAFKCLHCCFWLKKRCIAGKSLVHRTLLHLHLVHRALLHLLQHLLLRLLPRLGSVVRGVHKKTITVTLVAKIFFLQNLLHFFNIFFLL